jgi:uncharacterized protein YbjT (DUF2867 family)
LKRAVLVGASGHVGRYLLQELLDDDQYESVAIIVRRPLAFSHAKLRMVLADFSTLAKVKDEIAGDELFITIGGAEKTIEKGYPALISRIAKKNGVKSIFVITAVGADVNSAMEFTRVKGEIENDVLSQHFMHTHFFRVSMIMGRQSHFRPMEKTMMIIWRMISPLFFGRMEKYKGITGKEIANAIYMAAQRSSPAVNIYHWREMMTLVNG